jgi:1-acyl-sn-glycerol-3-phosphate acyltransferase
VSLPPLHWWRTVFFLIPAIALYTIVFGTASILSSFVDRTGDFGHRCARAWSWMILRTTGVRAQVQGLEHIDPRRSYVVAANHQSFYDIPLLFALLPLQLRIVSKDAVGRFPILGWHLRRTGHLLIDRKNPGADILSKMRRLVSESHSLIVFPEGTRSVDGSVGRFKKGSFVVAADAGLPVIPVSISGSRQVMTKGRLTTRPGNVRITIHPPVPTTAVTRDGVIALAERVREIVRAAVDEAPKTATEMS